MPTIALVIPALDEEVTIGGVVRGFLPVFEGEIVVVDNGSRDRTPEVARSAGATVVAESCKGYGSACLRGLEFLRQREEGPPEIVVFADGDGSSDPADLGRLLAPLVDGHADMVIGSRVRLGEADALTFAQRFGNALACQMMASMYGIQYSDLGPYRALTWSALERLDMQDRDFGWTVEMQLKAAREKLIVQDVDVHNRRRRGGRSKISGTVRGVVFAGTKIVGTILRHRAPR